MSSRVFLRCSVFLFYRKDDLYYTKLFLDMTIRIRVCYGRVSVTTLYVTDVRDRHRVG